jgi:formylglycine-generating enzyme required for sulfatase activity
MRKLTIVLLFLFHSLNLLSQKNIVEDLVFVEGSCITKNAGQFFILNKSVDTTKIYPTCKRIDVENFFISKHEVTNAEYRSFVNWVYDSIKSHDKSTVDIQKNEISFNYKTYSYYSDDTIMTNIQIYPDTLSWVKYFESNGLISSLYFWHPAYDNYPVVGVSWNQASAYCHWRTERFKETYETLSKTQQTYFSKNNYFRLPTEAEWELAATDYEIRNKGEENLIINGFQKKNGKFIANVGSAKYEGNLSASNFGDDGGFNTAPVMSYVPNICGIYDMLGNVSEWTSEEFDDKTVDSENLLGCENINPTSFYSTRFSSSNTELYITDPYTRITSLVTLNSPEHEKILKKRQEFYRIYTDDSKEVILEKYIGYHSVDTAYWDKILALNSTENSKSTRSLTDSLMQLNVLDKSIENRFLYDNCTGEITNLGFLYSNLNYKIERFVHNCMVRSKAWGNRDVPTIIIVKGGSWKDTPLYVENGSVEIYSDDEQRCSIGFRVAMDAPNQIDFLTNKDKKRVLVLRRFQKDNNSENIPH